MKKINYLLLLSTFILPQFAEAQLNFWRGQSREQINENTRVERRQKPTKSIQLQLNYELFVEYLSNNNGANKSIKFPNADGKFDDYILKEETALHPDLQKKYANLKSFVGTSTKNANEKIYLTYSPYFGLYANIVGDSKNILIDPLSKDKKNYIIYNKKDLKMNPDEFICQSEQTNKSVSLGIDNLNLKATNNKSIVETNYLRKFRLAVATTTEYSQFIIEQAGLNNATEQEKKAAILAAINISINRINGILKNDAGIILELIPDNDKLFFIDSDTYEASNAYQMIDENVIVLNNMIGANNYDLGHLFFKVNTARLSNGLANTPSVCEDDFKAGGVTGTVIPIGDPFDIDYTAHEIGHQLGALHTQNNSCYRSAYGIEPGSGSTIMAYTGICEPNVQGNSDPYFHTLSVEQINSTLNLSNHNCAIKIAVNNSKPVITTQTKTYNIPHSTAFSLKLDATDQEDKNLTYTWEQIDNSIGEIMPPLSSNTRGPMFRSFPPSDNSERLFPRLEKILSNEIVFETNNYNQSSNAYSSNNWEVIPNNPRTLTFRGTVRDNNIDLGLISTVDQLVKFESTGPFKITSQNTNETWNVGEQKIINWDVANTNTSPINTSFVQILLSTDGGLTWDKTITSSTPNNGTYAYTVPNNLGTTEKARLMIRPVDNIYLAINSSNFTIKSNLSTTDQLENNNIVYPNPSNGLITVKLKNSTAGLTIDVYDLTGRKIKTAYSNQNQKEHRFNLSELLNGLYVLKYQFQNQEYSQKIIIKK